MEDCIFFKIIKAEIIPIKQAKGSFSSPKNWVMPEEIAGPKAKPKVPVAI